MIGLLGVEMKRLFGTSRAWLLLALGCAVLGWSFLSGVEAVLAAQEQLVALPASVTRLLAMPIAARCALIIAAIAIVTAARWWTHDQASGVATLFLSSPRSTATLVLAKWGGGMSLAVPLIAVALAMALSLRLGAALDTGTILTGFAGLLMLAAMLMAVSLAASTAASSALGATLIAAVIIVVAWAPDAPALARGDNVSPFGAFAISRRLHPLLNGEFNGASVAFFFAATQLFLVLAWARLSRRTAWFRSVAAGLSTMFAVTVVVLAQAADWRIDFTATQRHDLHPSSIAALAEAPPGVEVLVPDEAGVPWRSIRAFLDRVQRHYPSLVVRQVSPVSDAAQWGDAKMRSDQIVLRNQGRLSGFKNLTELDFMTAFERLFLDRQYRVAYVTGSGERDLRRGGNTDWGQFGEALRSRGIDPVALDLLLTPVVPAELDLLIVAPARGEPIPGLPQAIAAWVEDGGRLWLAVDAGLDPAWGPLLEALGVAQLPGVVVDARASDRGESDPRNLVLSRHPSHPISQRLLQPVVVPRAGALRGTGGQSWTADTVLETTATSWNETGTLAGGLQPDGVGEEVGPLPLVLALERDVEGAHQRAIVYGDGDLLANTTIGNGANLELGLQTFWWLLEADTLIDLPARNEPGLWLDLSNRALASLGVLWLLVVPAMFAAAGFRRTRRTSGA